MYAFRWLHLCEIPNIEMSFKSAGIWAYLPSLHPSNWKRSLRTKRTLAKFQGRFRSKWRMVRRSSIRKIEAQYWILCSIQSTTILNTSVLMKQSGYWMRVLFATQQMTVFQAPSIQFQASLEVCFWWTTFGPSGSSWGDGFGMLICQEHWWRMKWDLERLSPRLQQQCFANFWLRKSWWGCHCPFHRRIPLKSGWYWFTTTFPALSLKSRSGICSRDSVLCPAACWRSSQHHPTGTQHWSQPLNQSW